MANLTRNAISRIPVFHKFRDLEKLQHNFLYFTFVDCGWKSRRSFAIELRPTWGLKKPWPASWPSGLGYVSVSIPWVGALWEGFQKTTLYTNLFGVSFSTQQNVRFKYHNLGVILNFIPWPSSLHFTWNGVTRKRWWLGIMRDFYEMNTMRHK